MVFFSGYTLINIYITLKKFQHLIEKIQKIVLKYQDLYYFKLN
jgi:hypothetical protein